MNRASTHFRAILIQYASAAHQLRAAVLPLSRYAVNPVSRHTVRAYAQIPLCNTTELVFGVAPHVMAMRIGLVRGLCQVEMQDALGGVVAVVTVVIRSNQILRTECFFVGGALLSRPVTACFLRMRAGGSHGNGC